ncbi:hypothetical protein MUP32_07150, partial [Candidatus Microgenomates bacterium]|nr:hypothetical protein [Candidatus Microgenomates bacterium]
MPELPEVETIRLQLNSLIIGQVIKDIQILKAKSFIGDKKLVIGKKIVGIRRFAKMLVIDLSNGLSLVVHLKMSGQLVYRTNNPALPAGRKKQITKNKEIDPLLQTLPNKHTRVIFEFQSGDNLFFNDMRIFGWMRIINSKLKNQKSNQIQNSKSKIPYLEEIIDKLGPEPFKDLTLEKFNEILKSSKKPVKLVLLDQEKIAGAGNIYANEALFSAKIHPKTPANRLSKEETELLYDKLLKVLKEGIKYGGASEDNYRDAYGHKGTFHEYF